MVSQQVSSFHSKAVEFGFRKIKEYLRDAPAQWMLTSGIALSFTTLSGITTLFMLGGLSSYLVAISREAMLQPWDARYERFGTCKDSVRSGLEQHIDCGGPEPGCPQICREKYEG